MKPTPMRRRFERHSALNQMLLRDWIKSIRQDPLRFEAILFRAVVEYLEPEPNDFYEPDDVESVDPAQQVLGYEDPVLVSVVDCPDDEEEFLQKNNSDDTLGEGETALFLRIGERSIPKGSVLAWIEEDLDGNDRHAWWYIQNIYSKTTQGAAVLFACVPCRNFEIPMDGDPFELFDGKPVKPKSIDATTPPATQENDFMEL